MTWNGPTVTRANASASSALPWNDRDALANHLEGFDGQRNLYDALGYDRTNEITFRTHWARYQRDGIATALVDRFVASTWQSDPSVHDGENPGKEEGDDPSSAFEKAVAALFSGDILREAFGTSLRQSVSESVTLADTYATLGEYSLLFLGFEDGSDASLEAPISEGSFSGTFDDDELDGLAYVTPISEAKVDEIEFVDDAGDPRHGLPETYDIQFDRKDDYQTVHHSRVIHIPQGTRVSTERGTPIYLKGWNRFDDLEKLLGGSAEMAWRGAYNGLAVQPPRDADGNIVLFDDDDEIEEQVDEYRHNLRRVIKSTGEIETLDPNVADMSPHTEMQFRALSATYDIPQSILMGNETGERATTEDRSQWAETIAERRNGFASERIVRPLIDRLRYAGVLPDPDGDEYEVSWEPLTELSQEEWADLVKTKVEAIKTASAGAPTRLFSEQELRKIMRYPPERGSLTDTTADDGDFPDPEEMEEEDDPAVAIDEDSVESNPGGFSAGGDGE